MHTTQSHTSQMPEIRQQQSKQKHFPNLHIARRAQHQRFVEREDEVQVCELVEDGGFAGRYGDEGGGGKGEVHVGLLVEGGVVGSYCCGDGFYPEEEEAVGLGDGHVGA